MVTLVYRFGYGAGYSANYLAFRRSKKFDVLEARALIWDGNKLKEGASMRLLWTTTSV